MVKPRWLQDQVRSYDKRHWQHPPGAKTLIHTDLHLLNTVGRISHKNSDPDYQVSQLSGCLLEHAARIANNTRMRITVEGYEFVGVLEGQLSIAISSPNVIVAEYVYECNTSLTLSKFYAQFLSRQADLALCCERLDHGQRLSSAHKEGLVAFVQFLLESACTWGPLRNPNEWVKADVLNAYFAPLAARLNTLELRHQADAASRVHPNP